MLRMLEERGQISESLKDLRRRVYVDEVKYLSQDRIVTDDDARGVHITLRNEADECVACVQVYPAEDGEFYANSGLSKAALSDAVMLTRGIVDPAYRNQGLFRLALYYALRRARVWGRERMVCWVEDGDIPAKKLLRYENLPGVPRYQIKGNDDHLFTFSAQTKPIHAAISHCYYGMSDKQKAMVNSGFADELSETLMNRIDSFMDSCPWVLAIQNKVLTREQYIESLSNMYQFVRLTTRIIARAVSLTEDSKLRRHFLDHLQGEVDHEVQIESDLRHLGADVDYVKNHMVANPATLKFMYVQEALLGYNNDPITYMAVPLCIEGFSARLGHQFLDQLDACISKWGDYNPKRAAVFLRVHVEEDGGDEGHWQNNVRAVQKALRSEKDMQRFLYTMHVTMDAIADSYASFVPVLNTAYTKSYQQAETPVAPIRIAGYGEAIALL